MRDPKWLPRFRAVLELYRNAEFKYGQHDCALLCARCVDAVTGSDIEKQLAYTDMRTALRFLKREGGLEAGVTRMLGRSPINGRSPYRADICLIGPTTIGPCTGPEVIALTQTGLMPKPLSSVIKYWRVI